MFDMLQKLGGGKQFATDLTSLECVPTHDFISDQHRSYVAVIFISNGFGRADIGTGQTSDAFARIGWADIVSTLCFDHFQRFCTDDFRTDPNTEPATNTSVGYDARCQAEFSTDFMNRLGMGGQFQEIADGSVSQLVHHGTFRGDFHTVPQS